MTRLEAIIQPSKLDAVKNALHEIGVEGLRASEARGHGRQKGHTETFRGREYDIELLPKIKIEIVIPDNLTDKAVRAIVSTAKTGQIGDGKIFLSTINEAIRIRDEATGDSAL